MRAGEFYFLDTNALLEATDQKRASHEVALSLFSAAYEQGAHLSVSGQVFREYLVVATRPVEGNGLGLDPRLAMENIESFLDRCIFFEETRAVFDELLKSVEANGIAGKRVRDANIVATMKAHRIESLITLNPKDFAAFSQIRVLSPPEALSEE